MPSAPSAPKSHRTLVSGRHSPHASPFLGACSSPFFASPPSHNFVPEGTLNLC